ncbi:hypothetical protein M409DRAFT_15817 [Zasmidium cellare ATCC 36951]|uniref:Uncharacterized protein n=1 Tax=Zasmidium cellare ATCC 36951 TaxID=1080233 RepID=A0A6A6D2A5_ZASCE|nr:uncharacterized protein M409DRAFT_15817 [Zasmidium cellare ATCC 36951]KAF2173537.1 hypothetical protein M409DRAFT_15817 [Zasmidium cellare ATCC 36951]
MSLFKVITGTLTATALYKSALADGTTSEPQFDVAMIAEAGPPPSPSIATNVPAQTIVYDAVAVESSAAAEQTSDPSKVKRNACDPQQAGAGPVPSPDTDSAFVTYSAFVSAASAAPTPSGYVNTFKNFNAMNNALGYMGFTLLDTYDVPLCSRNCDAINGCAAFNVAFERSPSKDPSPSGGNCEQPPTTTLIKCVFWGGPVTSANAVNNGQWRNNYHVVIAGSNGYVNQTVDYCSGYGDPQFLGSNAISAPNDCNGQSTYIGNQYWNDGQPFDSRRCAAACNAQTQANQNTPCRFFNTYVISRNGQSYGQYCAMYKQAWASTYATQSSQTYNGATYSISYSYAFANAANDGTPCVHNPYTSCNNPGSCYTYQQCNPSQNCYCGTDVNNNKVCFQSGPCSPTCSTNAQCPNGYICLNANSCCGYSVCSPNTVCANGLNTRHIFRKRQANELSTTYVPDGMTPANNGTDDSS